MAGLSKSGLERLHRVLSGHVERQEMPGIVALVARGDDVHVETLGTFLRQRICEPLGMRDTAFHVPAEKAERLATCYRFDRETRRLAVYDEAANSAWLPEPPAESGGGGLVSTLDDYAAFSRMMLQGGRHGRHQVLSRAAVNLMTADQLTPAQRAGAELFFGDFGSWGLGVAVDIRRTEIYRTPGRFGWDGGLGTSAYTDPAEGMFGILLTQRMMESPEPPRVFTDFWTLAYGALE